MVEIRNRGKTAFVSIFLLLLALTVNIIPTSHGLDFHGIDITNRESITGYYMDIPLTKVNHQPCIILNQTSWLGYNFFKRKDKVVNVMITFNNIKIEEKPIYLMWETTVNLPNAFSSKVYFKEDLLRISLTNNYYKMLLKITPDYSNLTLSIVYGGRATKLHWTHWFKSYVSFAVPGIKIYAVQEDIDKLDPNNPNFDPNFGNNGTNQGNGTQNDVITLTFWQRILSALKAVFSGSAGFLDWVIFVLVVFIGIILIGLLIKVLSWVFNK